MVKRRRLQSPPLTPGGGDYFPPEVTEFIPSGCAMLDCVLGGGWAVGRIANIVGDRSTGKTLLAIEACANFSHKYPQGKIWYREAEAAFDLPYAKALGLPVERVDFGSKGINTVWGTIEDIFEDLRKQMAIATTSGQPGLYIIDSLDALTSRAAQKRDVGEGSYNLEKQKILSQQLAETVRQFRAARMAIIFISQVRDRIGFVVGEKHRRSGGKALDFYATQIAWLSHLKTLKRTMGGVKRVTGIRVGVRCKKNKITMPFRECEFTIRFGYGIDDIEASLSWLEEVKGLGELGIRIKDVDNYLEETGELPPKAYRERAAQVRKCVLSVWNSVEARFKPRYPKYGD